MTIGGYQQVDRQEAVLPEATWSDNFAAMLAADIDARRGGALTWFNHYTAQRSIDAGVDISRLSYMGVDGLLLRRLVAPTVPRTSADLVLPRVLARLRPGARIALVGSTAENLRAASTLIEALPSAPQVVYARNGYAGLASPKAAARDLRARDAELVVVGLGAPLQDQYAVQLLDAGLQNALVATCGGWFDQLTTPDYYPRFAYHAKLNWAVRLIREPGRLWRRYTFDAVRAGRRRAELRDYLLEQGGGPLAAMVAACASTPHVPDTGRTSAVA